jgi:DNA-binding NtrC family response regulator
LHDDRGKEARTVRASQGGAPAVLFLLVMSPGGSTSVRVPEQGELVLGRAEDCDVRIEDAKLSRRHAILRTGARVEIVDLGSMNGTFVREKRLAPNAAVEVAPGDSIALGSTVLVLRRAEPSERPYHRLTHRDFEAHVAEEHARASRGAGTFALVRLRFGIATAGAQTEEHSAAPGVLAGWVRDTDLVAEYAPHVYELLLPNATPEDANARVGALCAQLEKSRVSYSVAVAAYPRDGRTTEALVEHASRVLAGRVEPSGDAQELMTGALERMDTVIRRVASGVINVLVLGETGVGKEVLARRIHVLSPRAKMPLVSINCAALSESLLESELFGHEKGAFTGAVQAKPGLLESANGGAVFLDEVGEMPLATQAKLLRVLEQREVTRVGALRPRPIDVRFVAATNRNLETEVAQGRFRQDLFFRLNGISLSLPPLRERTDEIEPLARMFIERACRSVGRAPTTIDPDALAALKRYAWPGNIRELRNVIERALLLCTGGVITIEHLPVEKMAPGAPIATTPHGPTLPPAALASLDAAPDNSATSAERQRIVDALEACAGNQSHAAKLLGISRGTLIKRIAEYGIRRPRKRE